MADKRAGTAARSWDFGQVHLDEHSLELVVSGQAVELERKPREVLLCLLRQAGKLVTKEELVAQVWPGRIISDSALTSCMAKLRDGLGDQQQAIKTVHGYGYRFVGEIRGAPGDAKDSATAPREAERRQLTILFCDLAGSARLSESADPEAMGEATLAYHRHAAGVVQRYEGHVAQVMGEGLLVFFGYPSARDDDAERAVRCACELLEGLRALPFDPPLTARIGIHTGPVVVGSLQSATGKAETMAMGPTTNLTARLQSVTEPDSVLISSTTEKLVRGLFAVQQVPPIVLAGLDKPLTAFRVLHASGMRTRLEAAEHLTPMAGREPELALIAERWAQAHEGRGHALLITAEPGLGKSRLILEQRRRMQGLPHRWLESRASPMARGSAYQPLCEMLLRSLEAPAPAEQLPRLEQTTDAIGMARSEAIPLLAPLLNLKLPASYAPSLYGPELKRKKTLELFRDWLLGLARAQPLVVVMEDLHWADASTLEVLSGLLEQIAGARILLLMTARPEFAPPWPARGHVSSITLRPLVDRQAAQMLDWLIGRHAAAADLAQEIKERAGGVPLFIEELTKQVLESAHDDRQRVVPSTLQDSLMARLDRQADAKEVAQVAAVIGRETSYKLLARAVGGDEVALQVKLKRLSDAELLFVQGTPPDARYVFKHALIQDTAYDSLLKSTRATLHGKIATAIEAEFRDLARTQPALMALHWEQAGQPERAVQYLIKAADLAAERLADAEALEHAEAGLHLLKKIPEGPARNKYELGLLLTLSVAKMRQQGYGHPEVEEAVARADELCEAVEDPMLLGRALGNLWQVYYVQARPLAAARTADQLIELARRMKVPLMEYLGLAQRDVVNLSLGRFDETRASAERLLGEMPPEASKMSIELMGLDVLAACSGTHAWSLWFLGFPERMLAALRRGQDRVDELAHPFITAWYASMAACPLHLLRRDADQAIAVAERTVALGERYGFFAWHSYAAATLALARCMQGKLEEGLALLRNVRERQEFYGTLNLHSIFSGIEAEQCLLAGRLDEAASVLDRATAVTQAGETLWDAELHRVRGDLALKRAPRSGEAQDRAEASYRRALETAQSMQAKALGLRAAMSFARLRLLQKRKAQAREILLPVYDWFTEGFDTPDLKDAKALLDEI